MVMIDMQRKIMRCVKPITHRSDKTRLQGFTLIELLVVISIISLLISILLPALKAARESARQAQCSTNLHQMSIAQTAYSSDFHWYAPGIILETLDTTGADAQYPYLTNWWYHLVRPYLGMGEKPTNNAESKRMMQEGVLWCPSQVKNGTGSDSRAYSTNTFHYQVQGAGSDKAGRDLHPAKAAQVDASTGLPTTSAPACYVSPESIDASAASSRMLFISSLGTNKNKVDSDGYVHPTIRHRNYWRGTATGASDPIANFVHHDSKSALMFDLHVQAIKADESMSTDLVLE
jgi:prepilin-type N-terminal cleavage/methylation domain-containing protein